MKNSRRDKEADSKSLAPPLSSQCRREKRLDESLDPAVVSTGTQPVILEGL